MNSKSAFLKWLALAILLLGSNLACGSIKPFGGDTVTLSDCYQIRFLGYSQITDQVSTWRYLVKERPCAQDLSNWMLELPVCATVVDASPSNWEVVQPDPNYHFDGIKWQTGAGFQAGEFTVVLFGELMSGMVQVGVKGPDVSIGTIEGPVCKMITSTPSVTPAKNTETPTPTMVEEDTPTPTRTPSASSGLITITDNDQTLTITCNGNAVEVRGNANVITLLGSCSSITVKGNGNQVYWQSGSPVITDAGNANIISQK